MKQISDATIANAGNEATGGKGFNSKTRKRPGKPDPARNAPAQTGGPVGPKQHSKVVPKRSHPWA